MNVTINRLDPNVPDPVDSRRRAAGRFRINPRWLHETDRLSGVNSMSPAQVVLSR
jgi:hypothetical protein